MTLDEFLSQSDPTLLRDLTPGDQARMFWKLRGLRQQAGRDTAFWTATNASLKLAYEKLDEQERELARAYRTIQDDLTVARQVQAALLPRLTPEMAARVELSVYHRQLTEVGGDYYDFFTARDGRFAIGVFDISGHGVSAALIMSFLKAQFTQVASQLDAPCTMVERVNEATYDFLREVRRYATVNFVLFGDESIRYVSGGGYGLLVHAGQPQLFHKRDPFIGLRRRPYQEFELPFVAGDLLALYTDGIHEAQDASGQDYTVRRLNELILANRERPVQEILDRCVEDYQGFRHADSDDITLVILRKRAR